MVDRSRGVNIQLDLYDIQLSLDGARICSEDAQRTNAKSFHPGPASFLLETGSI